MIVTSKRAAGALAAAIIVATVRGPVSADPAREAQALYIRAATGIVDGRYAQARRDAEALLRLDAHDARSMALFASVGFLQGRTAQARTAYARCAACHPDPPVDAVTREAVLHGSAAPFFRMLERELSGPYPDGPQPFDAVREAERGRYANGIRLLAPLVKSAPSRPDTRFYRALMLIAAGRNGEARRDLAVAVLFRPTLPDAGVPMPLDRLQQVALWALAVTAPPRTRT